MKNTLETILYGDSDKSELFIELIESFRLSEEATFTNPFNTENWRRSYHSHGKLASFDSISWQYSSFKNWMTDGFSFVTLPTGLNDEVNSAIDSYTSHLENLFPLLKIRHLKERVQVLRDFDPNRVIEILRETTNENELTYNQLKDKHEILIEQEIIPFEMLYNTPCINFESKGKELISTYLQGLQIYTTQIIEQISSELSDLNLVNKLPPSFASSQVDLMILEYSLRDYKTEILKTLQDSSNEILENEKKELKTALTGQIDKSSIVNLMRTSLYDRYSEYNNRLESDFRAYILRVAVAMDVNDLRLSQIKKLIK